MEPVDRLFSYSLTAMKPLKPWLTLALTLTGIVSAGAGQFLRTITSNGWETFWLVISIVGLVLAAVVAWVEKVAKDRSQESHTDELKRLADAHQLELQLQTAAARVALEDALDPLIESLGKVSTVPREQRGDAANQVLVQGLHAITHVVGRPGARIRASFFKVLLGGERQGLRAARIQSIGRSGRPRDAFHAGTPEGNAVFDMLMKDEILFAKNIRTETPTGMDMSRGRDYETFISAPARIEDRIEGMVTVDGPLEGDLSEADLPFIRAVSTVIATAAVLANIEESKTPARASAGTHVPES
jgi:hypothetical protein